jgi:hypothetical protein
LVTLSLLLALPACVGSPDSVELRTVSVQRFYDMAVAEAERWSPGAYLCELEVTVVPADGSREPWASFGFESPEKDQESVSLDFTPNSSWPDVDVIEHERPISIRIPILPDEWWLDSPDVLLIAQEHGGDDFLARHSVDLVSISLYLERVPRVPETPLVWRVSYLDWVTSDRLDIDVDPLTGEVLEVNLMPFS